MLVQLQDLRRSLWMSIIIILQHWDTRDSSFSPFPPSACHQDLTLLRWVLVAWGDRGFGCQELLALSPSGTSCVLQKQLV